MTELTKETADQNLADKAAEVSEDVLATVEEGQRAALAAVKKFLDTVDEAIPGDFPSRDAVVDGAMDMADSLVTTQYEFLRKVVRTAGDALGK